MKGIHFTLIFSILLLPIFSLAQKVNIEGYVFEDGNRGYLYLADVKVLDKNTKALVTKAVTNKDGVFLAEVDPGKEYLVTASKKVFEDTEMTISTVGKKPGDSVYAKFRMKRKPGYRFEVTLAEQRKKEEPVNAIKGATIEVYNNTKEEKVLQLIDHPLHSFALNFEQGNHYTIMVREPGYFTKRMEAYVNVAGCILCFDGVGEVSPGAPNVSDVLTEENKQGTLLANVELQKIKMDEGIKINNLYYETGSARLNTASRKELDKLTVLLKDNPTLLIEIGSHTDANGKDEANQRLSLRRANGVVDYLVTNGIEKNRLVAKGYGENKLVNGCKNGVKCSDRKHAKNRRTELKVIGYANRALAQDKSLFDIKEEERFEKMLKEVQSGEQIKVSEGEELPDEIKTQLSAEEIEEKIQQQNANNPTVTAPKDKTLSIKLDKPAVPESQQVPSAPVPKKQKVLPTTQTQNSATETQAKLKSQKEARVSKVQTTPSTVPSTTNAVPYSGTEKPVISKNPAHRSNGEIKVNTSSNVVRQANELPNKYTGYKVEFFSSPYELPASHDIFTRHGNIFKEQRKDGSHAYLLGDFKTETNAYNFLNSIMKERYPKARVIIYEKGRRKN